MDKDSVQKYFFTGLLLGVSVLVLFMLLPFLQVIVLSTLFGVILIPVHRKITKIFRGRKGFSAFVVVLLFIVIAIMPFIYFTSQIVGESKDVYFQIVNHSNTDYVQRITDAIEKPMQKIYPDFSVNLAGFASFSADWIAGNASLILSKTFSVFLDIVLILISLFFFLKDGSKFRKILVELSPLDDRYDDQIIHKIRRTIISTVRGFLFVAIIQGVLAGLGMSIFHVPHATLWGAISAVASVVPFGSATVYILAIIYTYLGGNMAYTLGLIIWATIVIGVVDNFVAPYLYSRGAEIHQLIMLFAVLGGIAVFGPIGFILGPVIVSLFFTLIDIYQNFIAKGEPF